ncbi:PP2C family serine/threonine-protein phosphatase [Bacillus sp. FJAT-47783]|uniref:PP2C family serine/threonine-protein phosphatase n=1 Tax=Bacillus sp. FJAT-47783 TaxID=2922712 RepID=UPI001FABD464|nr:PP2C family serine/threonine-protein phosphatase [Bacillus sp. FJAT-47783]
MFQIEATKYIRAFAYQAEKMGNVYCGDCFYMLATDCYFICVIADGLGSGKAAYESSSAICRMVEKYQEEDLSTLLSKCNEGMKNKRGATVSLLKVDFLKRECVYSSVGNIRFTLYSPSNQFIYPLPVGGYLSGKPQKYRIHTFAYEQGSTFILYSDGLKLPMSRSLLKQYHTVEEITKNLEQYIPLRTDDLTYVVGQLL